MRETKRLLFFALIVSVIYSQDAIGSTVSEFRRVDVVTVSQSRNSITGFVFGEGRTPVSGIYVELLNDLYSTVGRVRTNGSGLFSFVGLPSGLYNIKVVPSGTDFEEQSRSVSLVPVSVIQGRGAVAEQVDFYLTTRKKNNAASLAAPGVVFNQEVPGEAKTKYESGITDLSNKRENDGYEKLKKALEIFPDYFLALDRLGNEYLLKGHYSAAAALLTKALEINKRSFSSTFGLGLAEFRLDQVDSAILRFKSAIEIDKNSANAHLWLGIALHRKDNLTEALASLLHANRLSEGVSAEVHFQLARVYKDQRKFREAANELELYLKHKPDAHNAEEIKQIVKILRQKE